MTPYSGDRRLSPPLPHSTFSYLSPSAAPFIVERPRATPDPIPNAPNPSPCPDLPTAPLLYDSWVDTPSSYMAPVAGTPGYTGFVNTDGFKFSEHAPHDIYYDYANNFGTYAHSIASCSRSVENYRRTSKDLSTDFSSSVLPQSSLPPSTLDCLDKKPCAIPQPVNHHSAYDNYVSHPPPCSTYPLNYDLPVPSVAAPPEVCAITKTVSPTTDNHVLESEFSLSYMNPCRFNLDYFDTIQNEQKDLVGCQNAYKRYDDWRSPTDGMRIIGSYPLSNLGTVESYHIGESSGTGKTSEPSSEVKSDLKSLQASFNHACDLFTEPLELNNPVVDSPCWKGTPTIQQPSFGIVKNDESPYSADSLGDLHQQGNKLSEFSNNNSVLFAKHYHMPNSENYKLSESHNDTQPSKIGAYCAMTHHPGCVSIEQGKRREKRMAYKLGDGSENVVTACQQGSGFPVNKTNESIVLGGNIGIHVGSTSEGPVKQVSSHLSASPTIQAWTSTKESPHGNTSFVHKAAATHENLCSEMPINRGHCNPAIDEIMKIFPDKVTCRSRTQTEFIKSMYNLSVMLLSTCNSGYGLEESDRLLIQSTIENLNSLSPNRSKVPLKVDADSNCGQSKLEKMVCTGTTHMPEKIVEIDSGNVATFFRTFFLQDLNKLPEENSVADTKDAQMLVYKNLWVEAEASMCKLKYELQSARMKLAMKCHSQQTDAAPTDSSRDRALNVPKSGNSLCIGVHEDFRKQQNHVEQLQSNICSTTLLPQGGYSYGGQSPEVSRSVADQIDSTVLARLNVLKSCGDNIKTFHEYNNEKQQETGSNTKTDVVTDSASASKSGEDGLVEDIIKEWMESSKSKGDEADGAIVATLKDFMCCNSNGSSDEDINQDQAEASESIADAALMCSNDKMSSSGEDDANQCQRSNSEFGQLEDAVMERLQVLKRRMANATSIMEGELEVFHSDDQASSASGAQLVKKTELPDDVKCTASSDEAYGKISVEYLGTLLKESHVLPVAVEPARLNLQDEQLSCSPSEWEHVLKEDFYHPGNALK